MKQLAHVLVAILLIVPAGMLRADQPPQDSAAPSPKVASDPQSPAREEPAANENEDMQAIRTAIASYVQAFNNADAKALAGHWSAQGEYRTPAGNTLRVREQLEADATTYFAETKNARPELAETNIELLSPSAAVETGLAWVIVPETEPSETSYRAIVTGVAIGNRIAAVVRPIYSPYMWQLESNDSGATWDAAARTTFPGYAQSMARTQAGMIAVAHRFPQYSVNLSRDAGLNWDGGTVIACPAWAMGCLFEVEPDVLLATYMNWDRGQPLLAQLLRVTPKGIEPVGAER